MYSRPPLPSLVLLPDVLGPEKEGVKFAGVCLSCVWCQQDGHF